MQKMSPEENKTQLVVAIFNRLFRTSENTILQTGACEPFYQAALADQTAIIFSREDFLSSALHEIAHWCIAGVKRRQLDDFGYWYNPEGRNPQEQQAFEQVEIKPQAVEWALSLACEHTFHFSADNLSEGIEASARFQTAVHSQLAQYLKNSTLPERAQILFDHLNQKIRNNVTVEIPQCLN